MRYEHSLLIDAPIERIWRLTTDVTTWPSFMPTVQRLDRLDPGPLRVGSTARIKQPGQAAAVWTVTRLVAMREFTWETRRMGLRMTGGHLLEPAGTGTRNTLFLEVAGRGSGLFVALFGFALRRAIRSENAAFQRAAPDSAERRLETQ